MPSLHLRYSEAYDATLSGLTDALDEVFFTEQYDQWLVNYVEPAQQFVASVQTAWDEINAPVFNAFRQFGYHFYDSWMAYAVHHWPGVVGFKDPLTFFVGEPLDDVIVLLLHELVHCHEDHPANGTLYGKVKYHIFQRFADEHIVVRYHLPTICVQWAVLKQVFPLNHQKYISISCQHPLLQQCAEILKYHQSEIRIEDPIGSLLAL